MRKLVVLTFMSFDGVMQAPGGKGEDNSGDFDLEGWSVPFFDAELGAVMTEQMKEPFDLVLGRKTYDVFAGFWPDHPEEGQGINRATKYVASRSDIDTSWDKTIHLGEDVAAAIKALKAEDGPILQVHGSGNLIQTLLKKDLVDELWLKIFPVILGKGKKLFSEGAIPVSLTLSACMSAPGGVVCVSYKRNGAVELGTFRED